MSREAWQHIAKILKDLNLPVSDTEIDIGKKMVLVASMGHHLRPDQAHYIPYEELTDLVAHQLGVVMFNGSWHLHIRSCLEKYPLEFFNDMKNCELWYFSYKAAYIQAQGVLQRETGVRLP